MRYLIAPFLLIFVLFSACDVLKPPAPESAREVLATAEVSFTQAVRLATAHKSDLTPAQVEIVDRAISAGDLALDTAQEAVTAGNDAGDWIAAVLRSTNAILEVLQ